MVFVVTKVFNCYAKKRKELDQKVPFGSVTGYELVNRHKMEALTI